MKRLNKNQVQRPILKMFFSNKELILDNNVSNIKKIGSLPLVIISKNRLINNFRNHISLDLIKKTSA